METESRERKQINDGNAFTLFLKKEICTASVLFSVPLYTGVFHRHFYSDRPMSVAHGFPCQPGHLSREDAHARQCENMNFRGIERVS